MSIRLEPNDRNDLINLLINIPDLETERQRRQMLEFAGLGDFTKRIDLSGDTMTVVGQMVTYLSQYGHVNEIQTALGLFLITVKNITGYEQQVFIDQLLNKYQLILNRTTSEKSVTNLKEKKSLSGQQQEKLRDALIDAFPRKSLLEQLLWFEFDKNLDAIAEEGNLQEITFNLIITATSEGWVEHLIRAARKRNSGNLRLRDIAQELLTND